MRFRFSLEKPLQWVVMEEQGLKNEIGRTMRLRESRLLEMSQAEMTLTSWVGDPSVSLSPEWAELRSRNVPWFLEKIAELKREVSKIDEELTRQRLELGRVMMKRKGLESLRSRRFREHRLEKARGEVRRLDDVHSILRQGRKEA